MLLLTHRPSMYYDDPDYAPELVIVYDYSQAKMYPRYDRNGFEWENVLVNRYEKLRKTPKFINVTCVVNPAYKDLTFAELLDNLRKRDPAEKNQFRNHS